MHLFSFGHLYYIFTCKVMLQQSIEWYFPVKYDKFRISYFTCNSCATPPVCITIKEESIFPNLNGIIAVSVSLNATITFCYYFSKRPLMYWPSPEIKDRNLSHLSNLHKEVAILQDCLIHVLHIVLYNLLEFDICVCQFSCFPTKEILYFGNYRD